MAWTNFQSLLGMHILHTGYFYPQIHYSLEIMVIQEIKEIQQILQLKFSLRMTWVDARLDFYNIKMDETMNVISRDELNRIWLPIIIFHNTERGQRTINDAESFATISRTGQGTGSDSSIREDIH